MTRLVDAMRTETGRTENGMTTNTTTLNACVDLYGDIGAMRGQDKQRLIKLFSAAYGEDPMTAMRILFWARDVRGGSGERQVFRDVFQSFLSTNHPNVAEKNISIIPEFGRWDDLLITENTELEKPAIEFIISALKSDNGLCAKWMPRKGTFANKIRKHMQISPKEFRQLLVKLSNTVEQKMCAKEFGAINYSHVPSLAMSRYMTAFHKRDTDRFVKYREALKKGEAGVKVNAGAVYPYDIIKSIKHGGDKTVNQKQWESLENYLLGSTERIMPMCDVSGSMQRAVGGNNNLSALDVALSLGMYISERNEGPFKDAFVSFTEKPTLQYLKGNVADRLQQFSGHVGYNTNVEAAFRSILDAGVARKIRQEEMPTMLLIISDMEFDAFKGWDNPTAQQLVEKLYAEANAKLKAAGSDIVYVVPKTVWWKINARQDNNPVQFAKTGSALVSGFSPSLMKTLVQGGLDNFTPYSVMMKTISVPRYDVVQI